MESYKITYSLIALNVIVFLLVFSMPQGMMEDAFDSYSFRPELFYQAWRWVTAIFLHASASHLFFNMLGLYFFGKILEDEVDSRWYMAIYFLGAFFGTFVFMFVSPDPVVGASGAVFAVMGAAMLLNPIKKVHFYIFPLPLGIVALLFTMVEALVVFVQYETGDFQMSNVAHAAHLGGLFVGSLFAFFYDPKRAAKGILVLIVSFMLILLLGPIFGLITGIGGIVLNIIDLIVGIVLYTIASLFSFLWI